MRNMTKGYSSAQIAVRNATSNSEQAPTENQLAGIVMMTYDSATSFYEVMEMLEKRLQERGKNWRHVSKSLEVSEYYLDHGLRSCVAWLRKNVDALRAIKFEPFYEESTNVNVWGKSYTRSVPSARCVALTLETVTTAATTLEMIVTRDDLNWDDTRGDAGAGWISVVSGQLRQQTRVPYIGPTETAFRDAISSYRTRTHPNDKV